MSDAAFTEMFCRIVIHVRRGIAVTRYPQPRTNGEQIVDHGFDYVVCRPDCLGFPVVLGGRNQAIYLRLEPLVEPGKQTVGRSQHHPVDTSIDRLRHSREAVDRAGQKPEDVGQEHAHGFERQNIGECDLTIEPAHCLTYGYGVAANVPHVPNEWSDDLRADVGPHLLVERAGILDVGEGILNRLV